MTCLQNFIKIPATVQKWHKQTNYVQNRWVESSTLLRLSAHSVNYLTTNDNCLFLPSPYVILTYWGFSCKINILIRVFSGDPGCLVWWHDVLWSPQQRSAPFTTRLRVPGHAHQHPLIRVGLLTSWPGQVYTRLSTGLAILHCGLPCWSERLYSCHGQFCKTCHGWDIPNINNWAYISSANGLVKKYSVLFIFEDRYLM